MKKLASSAAIISAIAADIILTFCLVRHADGDVEAAPIVKEQSEVQ